MLHIVILSLVHQDTGPHPTVPDLTIHLQTPHQTSPNHTSWASALSTNHYGTSSLNFPGPVVPWSNSKAILTDEPIFLCLTLQLLRGMVITAVYFSKSILSLFYFLKGWTIYRACLDYWQAVMYIPMRTWNFVIARLLLAERVVY